MDKNFKTLKIQITGELFKYLLLCMCDKFFLLKLVQNTFITFVKFIKSYDKQLFENYFLAECSYANREL